MRVDRVESVLTRRIAQRDIQGMQSHILADPVGLWVVTAFPIWNFLLDSDRTVDVQIRFRSNLPINETSVGNDDPNQPYTFLAVRAKWLVTDRHARYLRCLRESLREK